MLKVAKFLSGLVLVVVIVWLGILNTQSVNIVFFPEILISGNGGNLSVPLFLAIIVAIFLGFFLGCTAEFKRSKTIRKSLKEKSNDLKEINMKLKNMEKKFGVGDDEIFSLLN